MCSGGLWFAILNLVLKINDEYYIQHSAHISNRML